MASASLAMEEKEVAEARHVGSMHMPKPFITSHPVEQQEADCLHVNTTNDNVKTELAKAFSVKSWLKGCVHVSAKHKWQEPKRRETKVGQTVFLAGKNSVENKAITTTAGQDWI